jgi:acetoacetyl-CoA reductase
MSKKICLITGGNRGIGLAITKKLIDDYKVFSLSLSGKSEFEHSDFINIKNDITNFKETKANIEEILKFNNIDSVIHNAGITRDKFFHKMNNDEWFDVINTNLLSVYNLLNLPINNMRANKKGDIIFISSVNAATGMLGQTNYAASKSGLYGLCKSLALENANCNIKVNIISPGYVNTDMTKVIKEEIKQSIKNQIPMKEFAEPTDIANTVKFIIDSKYITGSNIHLNGGLFMN